MPSWSLSEPFCSTSWSMVVYLSSSPSCLATCRLAVVLSIFGWLDTSHYLVEFKVSKARLIFEELTYWFVKTQAIRWSTVVKSIPSCGGDHLHRHVQELHASTTSLILDFGCIFFLFLFSLVLSSLSKCNVIAFTLHLRGGVKGIRVNESRVV